MDKVDLSSPKIRQHILLLAESFNRVLGYELLDKKSDDLVSDIFYAPFVLLSHDTQADPHFNFSNAQGLNLFEYNWDEFTSIPSRYSAETPNREERAQLLKQVTETGYIKNYCGVRISKTGKRFFIQNATVWNIFDENNIYYGQAAVFDNWKIVSKGSSD